VKPSSDALRYLVGICLVFGIPSIATAQVIGGARPGTTAPRAHGFLTALRTVIDVKHLDGVDADSRFNWDADVSIDLDVFDAGLFRGNVFINVETIVGDELRSIDPNQGNYVADLSVFVRLPRGELVTTFHHVSRHMVDRPGVRSISWNMLGVGYGHRFTLGHLNVDVGGRALRTIEGRSVDYTSQFGGYLKLAQPIAGRLSAIGSVDGVAVRLDPLKERGGNRRGGRLEGGLRIALDIAGFDLYVAREQRIDVTSPLRELTRWTQFGFRLSVPPL
jgi:hypothetical protein